MVATSRNLPRKKMMEMLLLGDAIARGLVDDRAREVDHLRPDRATVDIITALSARAITGEEATAIIDQHEAVIIEARAHGITQVEHFAGTALTHTSEEEVQATEAGMSIASEVQRPVLADERVHLVA